MKRLALLLAMILTVALAVTPLSVVAAAPTVVNGGGTAAGADTMSQFGMAVVRRADGSATGQFNCLMAGRSAMTALGLSLMAVRGPVSDATITGTLASFGGVGALVMKDSHGSTREVSSQAFVVTVTPGGAGVGTLTLSVPGVGFFMFERVTSGQITIH